MRRRTTLLLGALAGLALVIAFVQLGSGTQADVALAGGAP